MSEEYEPNGVVDLLTRQARIEARQFARVFATADGKNVLAVLKRDFGWDCATPVPGKDGEVSGKRIREWTGSRSVIATILHKVSMGEKLSENTNQKHEDNE